MDWSQRRVLIVGRGDTPAVDSAHCFLSAQGAWVDLATDPADALALLAHEDGAYAAAVICSGDFLIEELGPVRAIRQVHPDVALIVTTAPASRRTALAALELGADACLPEPFYRGELITLIERLRARIDGRPFAVPEVVEADEPREKLVDLVAAAPSPEPEPAVEAGPGPPVEKPEEYAPSPAPVGEGQVSAEQTAFVAPTERAGPRESAPPADGVEAGAYESSAAAAAALAVDRGAVRGRVLVVDDERLFRELLADMLRQRGFYVADADSEKQALWCLADGDYDVIVLDAGLTGSNGRGVRSFRQACPGVPVVVVTNLASASEEADLRADGAAACIGKPFDVDQLLGVLRSIMSPRRFSHPVLSDEELDALLAPDDLGDVGEPEMGL